MVEFGARHEIVCGELKGTKRAIENLKEFAKRIISGEILDIWFAPPIDELGDYFDALADYCDENEPQLKVRIKGKVLFVVKRGDSSASEPTRFN